MTDLKKWIEDVKKRLGEVRACKKRRLTPEEIRIRAELLRNNFPKALRMLEVAVRYLKKRQGPYKISYDPNATRTLRKINQISKEK